MTEINPDEAMADETTEAASDAALGDATPDTEPEPEAGLEPEDFDLVDWLNGIGPVIAEYPLGPGRRIPMRARTEDWRNQWVEETKDLASGERDRRFLAAHIVDERVTPDMLAKLQEHSPTDWAEMIMLAVQIDTRPTNLLAPRFLPGASA